MRLKPYECGALVVGSPATGLSAVAIAGHHGLKVLVVEKEPRLGGTTACSGGWLWIFGPSLAKPWGIVETPTTYLRHEAGNSLMPIVSLRFWRKARTRSISSPAKPRCISTCRRPFWTAPFYAIKLVIGDLKTCAGIKTDAHARAMDADGAVKGFDAVGSDMASMMGSNCPGAGIALGPALTFGYVAAKHSGHVILELSLPRSVGQVD